MRALVFQAGLSVWVGVPAWDYNKDLGTRPDLVRSKYTTDLLAELLETGKAVRWTMNLLQASLIASI